MSPHGEPSKEKEIVAFTEKKTSKEGNCSHFASPTKLYAFTKAAEGVVPVNQAMRAFLSWIEEHNQHVGKQIETNILSSDDPERLSYVL